MAKEFRVAICPTKNTGEEVRERDGSADSKKGWWPNLKGIDYVKKVS